MNTKLLMTASAIFMGILGITCSFLPKEVLINFQQTPTFTLILFIQILGALYFGFALLNWMAQSLVIGGIYSKPISIGNFCHFGIAGLALIKGTLSSEFKSKYILVFAIVYLVFAVLFGIVFFKNPANKSENKV
jgi:hypothetical protein